MRRERPGHDSIAGLEYEIESALKDKLDPADVPALLDTYRLGMKAKAELERGFRHVMYEVSRLCDDTYRMEWWGNLIEGFADAIRRLGSNKEVDAELFIREELQRSIRDYYREISPNILSKKAGYPDLQRVRTVRKRPRFDGEAIAEYSVDPLEDDNTMERAGYVVSSPECEAEVRDEAAWVESKAKTPLEKSVVAAIKAGEFSERKTTDAQGQNESRHKVRKALKTIKQRAGVDAQAV